MSAAVPSPVLQLGTGAPVTDIAARPAAPALALRVVAGPLDGADAPLREGEAVTIGRGFRNDVVLRDKSVADARVSLEADGAVARLRVLSGHVVLLGQRLRAPAEAALPHHLPLAIGDCVLAVGPVGADEAAWSRCTALVPHVTEAPANDAGPAPRSSITWVKDAGIGLCAFGALAACTMFLVPSEEAAPLTPPTELVRDVLRAGGYEEVLASARGEGERVRIEGFVASDERKSSLMDALSGLEVDYAGDVRSGEAAARHVSDLFASNGVPAAATYVGGGTVRVSGFEATPAEAERLRAGVLADMPYLTALELDVTTPAPAAPSREFTAEIVEAVGGEFGYVVTRDGGRFFVGAPTPQGGKITAIGEGEITIEDAGKPTTYTF